MKKVKVYFFIGVKYVLIAFASILVAMQLVVNFFYNLLEYAIDWLYYKTKKDE